MHAAAAEAKVIVTARNAKAGAAVAQAIVDRGDDAVAIACDVTSRADIEAVVNETVERFGALHALVHNAVSSYASRPVPFEAVDDANWDDQVGVALHAAFTCAQVAFEPLRAAQGTYLLLLSTAGMEGSQPVPAYSSIKGAQRAFVKSLAREWGPHGVRVNGLAPLAVTPAMADFFAREPTAAARLASRAALGRLGDAETDIGPPINFLLSDQSRFITGQTLVVDGGCFLL